MPPAMGALEALLRRDWEMETWRSYEAGMMRMIAQSLGAKKVPRYEELIVIEEKPAMTQEAVAAQRKRLLDGLNSG